MLRLVWKDLYINRTQIATPFALVAAIYILAFALKDRTIAGLALTFLGTYSLLVAPMFALSCLQTEEKCRTIGFLKSLPMAHRDIVASKYIAVLILAAAASALFTVLARLAPEFGATGSPVLWTYRPSYFLTTALTLPVAALAIVCFFVNGMRGARTAVSLGMAALLIGALLVSRINDAPSELFTGFFRPSPEAQYIIAFTSLGLYALLWAIACRVFERREGV